ncbi:unnamed protein product [Gongylonema pulchrum]|uniref:PDZ domain-containing protein n=1 Tax=Gongylonema pulchrum TaxID=637853 RepID=A0A183EU81_9BILA|nr:unnamed protein product [Gongylonema pulchrum]
MNENLAQNSDKLSRPFDMAFSTKAKTVVASQLMKSKPMDSASSASSSSGHRETRLIRYKNDMTGYIPYGARSREEYAIQEEFANHNGKGILLMAVVVAKNNGSVLTSEVLQEANEVS